MLYKCKDCNKKSTRNYNHEELCELHYLRKKPNGATGVLIRMRDVPPWKIKDRAILLKELRKHFSEKEIEETLNREKWYLLLKKMEIE